MGFRRSCGPCAFVGEQPFPDEGAFLSDVAEPPREIEKDEIGVTGFAPEGEAFPLAEVWQEVTGEAMPPYQPALVATPKPHRQRRKA